MSDKSSQLSVAELIARNGGKNAQAPAGGRRRRSGRGISVSELTGDLPVVPEGSSSHAGADPVPSGSYAAPDQSPVSGPITYFDPLAGDTSGGRRTPPADAQWQAPPAAPQQWQAPEPQWQAPPEPPQEGGRRSRATQSGAPNGYGPAAGGFEATPAAPAAAPASGGRRARREQREALEQQLAGGTPAVEPAPARSGRRRRKDDDEPGPADLLGYSSPAAPVWTPPREPEPQPQQAWAPPQEQRQNGWTPPRPEPQPPRGGPQRGPQPPQQRGPDPKALRGPEPQPPMPQPPMPQPPVPPQQPPRDSGRTVRELPPEPQQPPRGRGDRSGPSLPAWSQRRRVSDTPQRNDLPADDLSGEPTAVWSLAALDRQARSGGPVPRPDERGARPDGGRGRGGRDNRRRDERGHPGAGPEFDPADEQPRGRRGRSQRDEPNDLAAPPDRVPGQPDRGAQPDRGRGGRSSRDEDLRDDRRGRGRSAGHDDQHGHEERGGRAGWGRPTAFGAGRRGGRPEPDLREQTGLADSRTELFEPLVGDEDFDDARPERQRKSYGPKNGRKTPPGKGGKGKPRNRSEESMRRLAVSDAVARRKKAARGAVASGPLADRPWTMLGLQVAGAAVAGMLMFKGFEKMWDVLPFVALALAVVVILGLVALVRVLRRSDDIFSTVMAVVVGSFVTLGPLAFMLSTN